MNGNKLIIVEDDGDSRLLFETVAGRIGGREAVSFPNGEEFFQAALKGEIDPSTVALLVMDYDLPGPNWPDILRKMFNNGFPKGWQAIPVLANSAADETRWLKEGIDWPGGMDCCMKTEVMDRLTELLTGKEFNEFEPGRGFSRV